MNAKELQVILKSKIMQNKMHNLYIINPSIDCETTELFKWCHDIFTEIIAPKSLENHSDFLVIKAQEKTKQYPADILDQILKFTQYRSNELDRKFIIIDQLHFLSLNQLNKLLKTFEEPPTALTTILLNPTLSSILPTIASRAIQYRVQIDKNNTSKVELNFQTHYSDFYQEILKNNYSIEFIYQQTLDHLQTANLKATEAHAVKELLTSFEKDYQFNASKQSLFYKLYSAANYKS